MESLGIMMTILLFAPASKRWLGWRKTENPKGTTACIFNSIEMELSHMDEFIDELLREERACDVILPRIQVICNIAENIIQLLNLYTFYQLLLF